MPLTGTEPALDNLQMQLQFFSKFLESLDKYDRSRYYIQLSDLLQSASMKVQLITIWTAIIDDWDILQNCAYAYHAISNLIDLKKDWTINDVKAVKASKLINNFF